MQLYQHQQNIINLNPKKHLIAFGTGTGKTLTSLALTAHNQVPVLIIVPKALKLNWIRNIENSGLHIVYHIVTKEEFRRDWDIIPAFPAIIIDEFHFFANLKSAMSKALMKYQRKHNPTYVWGLTATPFCSSPMNIFALATHLGYRWNYWTFFNKFFNNVQMGRRMVPIIRKGIEKDVADLVRQIGTTCTMEECIDVPEQTFETIYLETTKAQQKGIKEIDEPVAITRWTRTHTIENGLKIGDEYTPDEYFECLKNDYIASFSEENPKFAVICRYNLQIEMLKVFLEEKGLKVFVINGAVKNRDEVVQEIERTDECVVLIQASCSVGFEIPSVPIMIFASLSFSFVDYQQAIGRIHRINKLKKNVYLHLVIKGGVDEAVYDCIMRKQDFDIAIYNK
jgi:superfamily II DNA or RNA helicase